MAGLDVDKVLLPPDHSIHVIGQVNVLGQGVQLYWVDTGIARIQRE